MSIFEIIMLVCFGLSWPISIVKSYRSRSCEGKSPWFLLIIIIGYIAGMIHKMLFSRDLVLALYFINALAVFIDLCLWFRNKRLAEAPAVEMAKAFPHKL